MLNSELAAYLKTMKFTGDAARQLKVSRQWMIQLRHIANIPCLEIGGYYLWTPDQIEQARQIIEKNTSTCYAPVKIINPKKLAKLKL